MKKFFAKFSAVVLLLSVVLLSFSSYTVNAIDDNESVLINGLKPMNASVIVSSIKLIDNLGNTLKTMTIESVNSDTFSCNTNFQYGDLNYDGVFTSDDVSLIMNTVSNYSTISNLQRYLVDYNRDGSVTLSDATALLKAIG